MSRSSRPRLDPEGGDMHAMSGVATPDLDEMERRLPGYAVSRSGSGSREGSEGEEYGSGRDWTDGMSSRGNATYPPERYDDEPDAATALLGGHRKTFGSRISSTLDRAGITRALSYRVSVFGVQVPWAVFLPIPLLLLLLVSLSRGPSYPPLPLLSNGTHTFHPTTLVVSLDGFRPSYLSSHAAQLPHLRTLAKEGVYGEMTPVFPTLTFPNHWSMLTGLYPSSHGIVANHFYRPGEGEFNYGSPETSWQGHWWRGEPAWSVAERHGRKALNFMWPGPPTTSAGISPSFFVPYAKWNTTIKYHKLLEYFDMEAGHAPTLLFMYLPDADQAGHGGGPESERVSNALVRLDTFVGDLRAEIAHRNMSHIVDLVVVSDHGMAALSEKRIMFLDDILGDKYSDITHKDGWPSYGLWFADGADYSPHLATLEAAAKTMNFSVYTHETMPERWHFSGQPHIAPIYLVPDLGWLLTDHDEWDTYGLTVKGAHGFDNAFPEMHAVFFTDGPAAERMKANAGKHKDKWLSTSPAVMKPFRNLELHGLLARLQECVAPPHNGTHGFWDAYLGEE